jgi:hypothetical protein
MTPWALHLGPADKAHSSATIHEGRWALWEYPDELYVEAIADLGRAEARPFSPRLSHKRSWCVANPTDAPARIE